MTPGFRSQREGPGTRHPPTCRWFSSKRHHTLSPDAFTLLMRDPGQLLNHPKLVVKGSIAPDVCEAWVAGRKTTAGLDLEPQPAGAAMVTFLYWLLFERGRELMMDSAKLPRCTARPRIDLWILARTPDAFKRSRVAWAGTCARFNHERMLFDGAPPLRYSS